MKTVRLLSCLALSAALLGSTLGCEIQSGEDCTGEEGADDSDGTTVCAKSLNRFEEVQPRSASAIPAADGTINIISPNGSVEVIEGNSTSVSATFEAFVLRAHDTEDDVILEEFEKLETTVTEDGGDITVRARRLSGATGTLGAEITVEIPSDFAGRISIDQENGGVDVDYTANATDLRIVSGNSDVEATVNRADAVDIATENGDIVVDFIEIVEGARGGVLNARGPGADIEMTLPSGDLFNVQATATEEVDFESGRPAECTVAEAAVNSKTLSCNGATSDDATWTVDAAGLSGTVTTTYR